MSENIKFSILMPTYNQCAFIRRAIYSLLQQTYCEWELIIINDGCTDETEEYIADCLTDDRITYIKNKENTGLGHALNQGLDVARYNYIAYLPSDDFYFENHLETLKKCFEQEKNIVLVYCGMQYETNDSLFHIKDNQSYGTRPNYCLQLVQTAHKNTRERWTERSEWTSEDLFAMFWRKLTPLGIFTAANKITTYWTQHPHQRHKIISETYNGGLNKMRSYYKPKHPIKLRISKEKFWDEDAIYRNFRKPCKKNKQSLKILLVGELAYNPERIYALEEAGHKLYGLWIPVPHLCFSTIGPLPFGNVEDLNQENWKEEIIRIQPDIIYGMLNSGSAGWVYTVARAFPKIPFAWHLKEGPQLSIRMGNFKQIVQLYNRADVKIFLNNIVYEWFKLFIPHISNGIKLFLDGDLPKKEYFGDNFSKKISEQDGEIHTLIVGRMIGLRESDLQVLTSQGIHIHLYTENYYSSRKQLLDYYLKRFPKYFHLHKHVPPPLWTSEFSKYDAGWLHNINSSNNGNLLHASWDDLNLPARISTYMAAGIPVIHADNNMNIVAIEQKVKMLGIGICYKNLADLSSQLKNKNGMKRLLSNVIQHRMEFCFDTYVPELISAFREAIRQKRRMK